MRHVQTPVSRLYYYGSEQTLTDAGGTEKGNGWFAHDTFEVIRRETGVSPVDAQLW
jgi:hypothetical protein